MANTQFVVNATRFDPYKNFKFRVKWDGKVVAGMSKVSTLQQSTQPVEHREGGDPSTSRKSPSTWSFEAITLERGVTHDPEFENWARLVWNIEGDAAMSLANFRKDITIQLLNEQGTVVKAYNVYRCWVSEYQALPELDANGSAVAIERVVLQNEGWERDEAVVEPAET
ncbi:MAG: phage tail protein [Saprospiraceae bacterium]|nr:phage tail protein [Lewinella sp.]